MTITPKDRKFLESLFGRRSEPPAEEDAPGRKPNYVPAEGGNARPLKDEDEQLREFASQLFHGYYDG